MDTEAPPDSPLAVDLDLELVLGSMPNKTFRFERTPFTPQPLALPQVSSASQPSAQCAYNCPSKLHRPCTGIPRDMHLLLSGQQSKQHAVSPGSERRPMARVLCH